MPDRQHQQDRDGPQRPGFQPRQNGSGWGRASWARGASRRWDRPAAATASARRLGVFFGTRRHGRRETRFPRRTAGRSIRIHPEIAGIGPHIARDEARALEGVDIAVLDGRDIGGANAQAPAPRPAATCPAWRAHPASGRPAARRTCRSRRTGGGRSAGTSAGHHARATGPVRSTRPPTDGRRPGPCGLSRSNTGAPPKSCGWQPGFIEMLPRNAPDSHVSARLTELAREPARFAHAENVSPPVRRDSAHNGSRARPWPGPARRSSWDHAPARA
jgi:hypothetical protein